MYKKIAAIINLIEATEIGLKFITLTFMAKKAEPQIALRNINRIKLLEYNFFNKKLSFIFRSR